MKTRKILAPFDQMAPTSRVEGFLYPDSDSICITSFVDTKKGRCWPTGLVVLVGREISENDLFAKIVDSGRKVSSVDLMLAHIENYLQQVASFKIGDVVGIEPAPDGFRLVKLKRTSGPIRRLPK